MLKFTNKYLRIECTVRKFILCSCVLDHAAMKNAYNICHSVQDLFYVCGFFWEGAGGKGKRKGKGCKKKGIKGKKHKKISKNKNEIFPYITFHSSFSQDVQTNKQSNKL